MFIADGFRGHVITSVNSICSRIPIFKRGRVSYYMDVVLDIVKFDSFI